MSFLKKLFGKTLPNPNVVSNGPSVFELYQNRIYPWVKVTFNDTSSLPKTTHLQLTKGNSPVNQQWIDDLSIFYAADTGENFQLLLEKDLPQGVSIDELHQLAVKNLNRDVTYEFRETNFGGYGLIAGGDHEAGSICLPSIWEWVGEQINDNLIVAIPAKDLVLFVAASDENKISDLKIFVYEMFQTGNRLLTKNIFFYNRITKEWTIFDKVI